MASTVEDFLTAREEQLVITAIRDSEAKTSGELRVHLEHYCKGDALSRAQELFHLLKMDRTKEQNGVLIYVAVDDHKFAIFGDIGIYTVVPEDFWTTTKDKMTTHFKHGNYAQGLIEGVQCAGEKLAVFFPSKHDDSNELPDEITTS